MRSQVPQPCGCQSVNKTLFCYLFCARNVFRCRVRFSKWNLTGFFFFTRSVCVCVLPLFPRVLPVGQEGCQRGRLEAAISRRSGFEEERGEGLWQSWMGNTSLREMLFLVLKGLGNKAPSFWLTPLDFQCSPIVSPSFLLSIHSLSQLCDVLADLSPKWVPADSYSKLSEKHHSLENKSQIQTSLL